MTHSQRVQGSQRLENNFRERGEDVVIQNPCEAEGTGRCAERLWRKSRIADNDAHGPCFARFVTILVTL